MVLDSMGSQVSKQIRHAKTRSDLGDNGLASQSGIRLGTRIRRPDLPNPQKGYIFIPASAHAFSHDPGLITASLGCEGESQLGVSFGFTMLVTQTYLMRSLAAGSMSPMNRNGLSRLFPSRESCPLRSYMCCLVQTSTAIRERPSPTTIKNCCSLRS